MKIKEDLRINKLANLTNNKKDHALEMYKGRITTRKNLIG